MRVTAKELKAHLDEHLAAIEGGGEPVTIVDTAGKAIAQIVPMRKEKKAAKLEPIHLPPPGSRLGDLHFEPLDPPIDVDVVELLMEMRRDKI